MKSVHDNALSPRLRRPSTSLHPWLPALLIATVALGACGGGGANDPAPLNTAMQASTSVADEDTSALSPSAARARAKRKTATTTTTTTTTPTTTTASGRWTPQVSDTWQWQLSGTINTSVDAKVYDVDLFDTPAATISALKGAGRRVVCYFSAGSSENWRSDFSRFAAADMGNSLDGWAGERWLDTRSANVREIMKSRLDLAASRGCDGVEPDNVDGYTNNPGFPLTATTQVDYNRFLATEAHNRGLAVALKNAVDLLTQLEPDFDFAINEQCHQYSECGGYSVFTNKGKAVFNAEYKSIWKTDATARASLCASSIAANIRTLVLPLALDGSLRYSCD
jgi:hypothetical protein